MKVSSDSCFGDSMVWPPGFRFHPTDEELVLYYLKRRICRKRLKLDIIGETDIYKWDPEELPGQSMLKTGDRQWFFFSPRDRKYPNGARANRATRHGYWKATGKDRNVTCNSRTVGVKKTLVFYKGRAPNGARTDWVMHEYSLDEEEIKRCQNVQDYCVLHKVYKKSGPGPKNGEQYGAPFREEDWADDYNSEVHNAVDRENSVQQPKEDTAVDIVRVTEPSKCPLINIEDFINEIAEEPVLPQPQVWDNGLAVPQVVGEEESPSTLMDPSFGEVICSEPVRVLPQNDWQYAGGSSLDFAESLNSNLHEAPEDTSASNNCAPAPYQVEDDFLEMDDLLDSTFCYAEKPVENLQFNEFDGLRELDLYHDAAMFLQDIGPIDQGTVSHPYVNAHSVMTHVDYQAHPQSIGGDLNNTDPFWMDDQRNVFSVAGSNPGIQSSPTSGVVCESNNICNETNQNGNDNDGGGAPSWFSSSLWSFVESIPTTPASASENPLVNRAFERMSSFSRMRINARNPNGAAPVNGGAATLRRGGSSNKGFFLLSMLGALCAILWVLVGTIRVFGRGLSS